VIILPRPVGIVRELSSGFLRQSTYAGGLDRCFGLWFGSYPAREVLGRRDEGKPTKSMFGLSREERWKKK
jgi:hypothetical protein